MMLRNDFIFVTIILRFRIFIPRLFSELSLSKTLPIDGNLYLRNGILLCEVNHRNHI